MELKEFKITVLPLRAKLLNYARKLTDEPEDAEDAVQEVLLKLWNKRLELEQYRSIEAFAMTLTHNICIDMWRCKRNDTLSLDIVQAASPTGTPERLLEIKDEIVPTKSQSETICNNWRSKSSGIYEYLVNQLWMSE